METMYKVRSLSVLTAASLLVSAATKKGVVLSKLNCDTWSTYYEEPRMNRDSCVANQNE